MPVCFTGSEGGRYTILKRLERCGSMLSTTTPVHGTAQFRRACASKAEPDSPVDVTWIELNFDPDGMTPVFRPAARLIRYWLYLGVLRVLCVDSAPPGRSDGGAVLFR